MVEHKGCSRVRFMIRLHCTSSNFLTFVMSDWLREEECLQVADILGQAMEIELE